MEKHFIDIFVPHIKLRKGYYLVSALLLLLWIPDLSKLNIPLPSTVLETWFLDKLLITVIVLLFLYSFSTYYLSHGLYKPKDNKNKVDIKNYEFKDGLYAHKETGKRYCQPCLLKGIESELTDYAYGPLCQNCGKQVGCQKPA